METFKTFDEITQIDKRHILLGQICGSVLSLNSLHSALSHIELHSGVPEDVLVQFNVARNMALYTFFHYSMAPEVQMKTYSVIELALKRRFPEVKQKGLTFLLKRAVSHGLLVDRNFRHLSDPDPDNSYSKELTTLIPELRNASAHGSTDLTPECVGHIEKCADLINQLFSRSTQSRVV